MAELKKDILARISPDDPQIFTFDSFAYLVVKLFAGELGYSRPEGTSGNEAYSQVRVINSVTNKKITAGLLNRDEIEGLNYKAFTSDEKVKGALSVALTTFATIKENRLDLDAAGVADTLRTLLQQKGVMGNVKDPCAIDALIDLYKEYDAMLKEQGCITFADMLPECLKVCEAHPDFIPSLGIKYLMIDEGQDTNPLQIELVKEFKKAGGNVMIVGDDMQSIYAFRGATAELFLDFAQALGVPITELNMEGNFRSTEEILTFGNAIQDLNTVKVDKKLVCATGKHGPKPLVRGFHKRPGEKDPEYTFIAENVKKKIEEGYEPSDIAILTYSRDEGIQISQYLEELDIPFVVMNPMILCENCRVKAALALCNAFYEPEATKLYLTYMAAKYDGELLKVRTKDEIFEEIDEFKREFMNMENLEFEDQRRILHEYLEAIKGTDEIYEYFLSLLYDNDDFVSELEFSQDFQQYGSKEEKKMEQKYEGVAICTAHSSKGLEWPVVFNSVTKYDKKNLHSGRFSEKNVEEARRLLFVSATRARDELYLTGKYIAYGSKEEGVTYNQFLVELYKIAGQAFDPVDHEAEARKAAKEAAAKAKKAEMAKKRAEKAKKDEEFLMGTGGGNKTVAIPSRAKSSYSKRVRSGSSSRCREMTESEKAEYDKLVAGAVQTSIMDWI